MNENDFFEKYKAIVDRAHSEFNFVRSAYFWLSGLIAFIIIIGIYFTHRDVTGYKEDVKSQLKEDVERLKLTQDFDLKKETIKIEQEVKDKIDTEFDRGNIKELVEVEAKKRIESYTELLIEDLIKKKVEPVNRQIDELQQKVIVLQDKNAEALNKLEQTTEFMTLVMAAENNDRKSWALSEFLCK